MSGLGQAAKKIRLISFKNKYLHLHVSLATLKAVSKDARERCPQLRICTQVRVNASNSQGLLSTHLPQARCSTPSTWLPWPQDSPGAQPREVTQGPPFQVSLFLPTNLLHRPLRQHFRKQHLVWKFGYIHLSFYYGSHIFIPEFHSFTTATLKSSLRCTQQSPLKAHPYTSLNYPP